MIKDEMGRPMEARKVFGAVIKYLKDHLVKKSKSQLPGTQEEDIKFVLTVPAIWNEGAKQFMRGAAIEVCTNQNDVEIGMHCMPIS